MQAASLYLSAYHGNRLHGANKLFIQTGLKFSFVSLTIQIAYDNFNYG
jgi:hypothetical protein